MRISCLFNLKYGVNLELLRCEETTDSDGVNFVARTSQNNGVVARVKPIKGIVPQKAGTLSCATSGSVLSTFVQDEPYYSGRDLYVLTPKVELTKEQKMFYAMVITQNKYRYSYGRAANKTLKDIEIPSLDECNTFIGDYKINPIKTIIDGKNTPVLITKNWKEFYLNDLFRIYAGKYYYKDEYNDGNTAYITASNEDNAIAKRIDIEPDFDGNVLTIGKVGATTYYQSENFCATSDVNILRSVFRLNKYIGLFLVTVINFSENYKWNYGRQARISDCKEMVVRLPVSVEGQPDWQFMEDYIKSLPYSDII